MPIDDPIDAAEAMIASDQRQRSALVQGLADIVDLLPPVKAPLPPLIERISKWLDNRRAENHAYLLNVVKEELQKLIAKVQTLSNEQNEFLNRDFLPLLLEGFKRAENLRARERIERIGKILGYAAEQGTKMALDHTEEMMRVAMDLTDDDVIVLREIYKTQAPILERNQGRIVIDQVNEAWRHNHPKVRNMDEGEMQSICAKLQSFGLVTQVERRGIKLGPNEIPYGLLQKGHDFVLYIQGVTEEQST